MIIITIMIIMIVSRLIFQGLTSRLKSGVTEVIQSTQSGAVSESTAYSGFTISLATTSRQGFVSVSGFNLFRNSPPEVFLRKRFLKNAVNLQENTHAEI